MPPNLSTLEFLVASVGLSMWAHIALAFCVRVALRFNDAALMELFAFAPLGRVWSQKPHWMRIGLFFPWVKVDCTASCSTLTKSLVWSARLSGTTLLVGFIAMVCYLAYMVLSGA